MKQLQLRAKMAQDFVWALINAEPIEEAMKNLFKKRG